MKLKKKGQLSKYWYIVIPLIIFGLLIVSSGVFSDVISKDCSDFKQTADGNWYCVDDRKVYSCDGTPTAVALSERCDDSVDLGILRAEHILTSTNERFLNNVSFVDEHGANAYVDSEDIIYSKYYIDSEVVKGKLYRMNSLGEANHNIELVDSRIIPIEEAPNFINDFVIYYDTDDPDYVISVDVLNYTAMEGSLKITNPLLVGEDIPLRWEGNIVDTKNFKSIDETLYYNITLPISGEYLNRWITFGLSSTNLTVTSNSSDAGNSPYFGDMYTSGPNPDLNSGGSFAAITRGSTNTTMNIFFNFTAFIPSGQDILEVNWSVQSTETMSASLYVFQQTQYWYENTYDDISPYNSSYASPYDGSEYGEGNMWEGGNRTAASFITETPACGETRCLINFTNLTAVQELYEGETYNYHGWYIPHDGTTNYAKFTGRENVGAWNIDVLYETTTPANTAPYWGTWDDWSINEDDYETPKTFNLYPNITDDEDADNTLEFSWIDSDTSAVKVDSINNATGDMVISTVANQSGSNTITLIAVDPSGLEGSDNIVITVNAVNDIPVVDVDDVINQSVVEDSLSSFYYNLDNVSWDYEDDLSSVNMTYGIDDVFGDNNASGTNCSIELDANLYCVNEGMNRTGDNILNITSLDSDGAMISWFMNISTFPVNDIPVWEYDMPNQTCNEDDTCTVEINLDYYSWDIEDDANGVNMTYSIVSETGSSIIDCELNVSGTDMYCTNQDNNQSGDNIINISAVDADGSCESIQFNASVMGVNDAPDATALNLPLNDTNFSSIPEFNWNNSTDLEGDPVSYVLQIDESPEFTEPVDYYNGSIAETDNTTEDVSVSLPSEGGFFWRTLSTDGMDNSSWSEVFYFTYDITPPLVIIDSPVNNSYSNETIDFNFTAVDNIFPFDDLTFWYSNDSGTINYSISSNTSFVFKQDYSYHLNLWVNDTNGNENVTSIDFMIDTVNPTLSIVSPHSGGSYSNNVPLEVSVVDTNLDTVWYEVIVRQSGNSKLVNTTFTSNISLQNLDADNYKLHVYANDSLNNIVTSSVEFGLVESSTGGGSGGGGGASSPIAKIIETISQPEEMIDLENIFFPKFDIDLNKIEKKSFTDIKKDEFISFTVNGYTRHSITVSDFDDSIVVFEIASSPQIIEIGVLDSKDIDVNGDGLIDINIYVAGINPDSVNFIVKRYLQGTLGMAREETKLEYSPLYMSYKWIIWAVAISIFAFLGYDWRRKKPRFTGWIIGFIFILLAVFISWKSIFMIIGWKIIKDSTNPFFIGGLAMALVWVIVYHLFFKKRRKEALRS